MKYWSVACSAVMAAVVSACAQAPIKTPPPIPVSKESNGNGAVAKANHAWLAGPKVAYQANKKSRAPEAPWLRDKVVSLNIKHPVPASEIVRLLRDRGINITSTLPLDNYLYSGFGVTRMDAETAMRVLFGAMGLDYTVNEERQFVVLRPMRSRTWYVNLGNRQSSYAVGSDTGSSTSGGTGQSGMTPGFAGAGTPGSTPSTGASGGGVAAATGVNVSGSSGGVPGAASGLGGSPQGSYSSSPSSAGQTTGGNNGNSITANDNFWSSLAHELDERLKILVPGQQVMNMQVPSLPAGAAGPEPGLPLLPLPTGGGPSVASRGDVSVPSARSGGPGAEDGSEFVTSRMGRYSINPETGAVTVQAPYWMLDDLEEYFRRVVTQYNTVIEFDGEMLLITTTDIQTKGIDLTAFAEWAQGRMRAVVSNNVLGGLTVAFPTAALAGSVVVDPTAPAQTVIGGQFRSSRLTSLEVFNAYLRNFGNVDVMQRPVVATTSGIPGEFVKFETRYYNLVNQTTASSLQTAVTGVTNTLVPVTLGTRLRINPRFDADAGFVRAQISLQQTVQSGTQQQVQFLAAGNDLKQIATDVPVVTTMQYSGEMLLRDGDLIVVGGQTEHSENTTHAGVTGLMDSPVGLFTSRKQVTDLMSTHYFALSVRIRSKTKDTP